MRRIALMIFIILSGGFGLICLTLSKSSFLIDLAKVIQLSIIGLNLFNSAWHLALSSSILAFISDTLFSSSCAIFDSPPTIVAFSWAILFLASASTLIFEISTDLTSNSFSNSAIDSLASFNLFKPDSNFCLLSKMALTFCLYIDPNNFNNSKNDFGVIYVYLLSASNISWAFNPTILNDEGINLTTASKYSACDISSKSFLSCSLATDVRASSGQGWNQSITVLLIIEGNFLALFLKFSPGEKHKHTCKFFLTLPMKKFQTSCIVSFLVAALHAALTLL